jgi:hypothetical protein
VQTPHWRTESKGQKSKSSSSDLLLPRNLNLAEDAPSRGRSFSPECALPPGEERRTAGFPPHPVAPYFHEQGRYQSRPVETAASEMSRRDAAHLFAQLC